MRTPTASATSKPVLSATVNVAKGDAYTVAGMGPASGLQLQVLRDRLKTPPGKALVRVIQASMHQTAVTVRAGHSVLGRKLKFTCLMNSSGSKVMPNGSVDMGFGGMAQRPGASLLPWLAAAVAGLLAAAAGLLGLRRRPAARGR